MRCSKSRYYSDERTRRHFRKIAEGEFFEVPLKRFCRIFGHYFANFFIDNMAELRYNELME